MRRFRCNGTHLSLSPMSTQVSAFNGHSFKSVPNDHM